jgi:purine nucleosidase/pyrimidine-specific ribonucleoside hydrolase
MVFISGSHTNLAEALRLKRSIVQNIRDVYIMGGAIHVPGNIESDWPSIHNRVSEWNIWVDPEAAGQVFASGLAIHLVPLDATQQVVWTRSDLSGWISSNSPEGAWAGKLLQWMLQSWSPESVYIWDLVAAVQATNPALCPEISLTVSIVATPGPDQGRTVITKDVPNAAICLDPDPKQVKAVAASILVR